MSEHATPPWVETLRAEIALVRSVVDRDIADTKATMLAVEERATRADRFVRRVIAAAAAALATSIVTGAVLLYQAGEKVGTARAEQKAYRIELVNRIDQLESTIREMRGQPASPARR
jgi:hypothetical protein